MRMNPDYIDMLKCLNAAQVDYLLVGGWAVNLYGYVRTTVDLDIWILADAANAHRVCRALADFGAPMSGIDPRDFEQEGVIFQVGVAPCRIDVITKIDGVRYSDAAVRSVSRQIGGVPVRVISVEDLIANKRSSGRTKDLADAEILEGLRK